MTCNRFDSYWRWYNGVAVASFFSKVVYYEHNQGPRPEQFGRFGGMKC